MCGFLGSINISFNEGDLNEIHHRGPDGFGINDYEINNHKIKFGHKRLSIIDLTSAGHQPMISKCEKFSIIFNGEIYNHLELRTEIEKKYSFNGHSDTETILYYLIEFGIEAVSKFNGIFSFAFIDIQKQKLFAFRDPFGVKPFYYHINNNTFVFSSEIRPIKKIINPNKIDFNNLATLLRVRYNPSPETLFKEIKKIRPCHYFEIDLTNSNLEFEEKPYFNKKYTLLNNSYDNILKGYEEKIENAIRRQLISDVEIGIFLSGGIDSAIVASIAKKHYKGNLKAFTIGFEGNNSEDEINDASETAKLLGIEHHYQKISFTDFISTLRECSKIVEEPIATTSIIPMYYLSKLASKHVKVVLTGQGADEPLGGYNRYKSELYFEKTPFFLKKIISIIPLRFIRINENLKKGIKSLTISDDISRFIKTYEIFNESEIEKLINIKDQKTYSLISYMYKLLNCSIKEKSVERMMSIDTRMNLSDDLLLYTDKITMNFSIECRVPLLDIELVDYIESIPTNYKLNRKQGKLIHKDYARTILPEKIIYRTKKGFLSPTKKWFKDKNDEIKSILFTPNSTFSTIFNLNYVEEILNLHKKGINKEKQIFLLLSIHLWLEENNISSKNAK